MTDPVTVPRATLRGIRASVAVIVLGVAMTLGALVIKVFSDHDRCLAGNEFRRRDLPAAFELSHRRIGEALGASPERIGQFDVGFQRDLHELLPERDCSWL